MEIEKIKERLLEFLRNENMTSAQFAHEIGVQASGISHIISGRNKPSLEFIVKMLNRYPSLSIDWIVFGKGQMYREGQSTDLFSLTGDVNSSGGELFQGQAAGEGRIFDSEEVRKKTMDGETTNSLSVMPRKASRIIIFNEDGTFSEHFPE